MNQQKKQPSGGLLYKLITPILVLMILVLSGILVYLLYGDRILERFGPREEETVPVFQPVPESAASDGTTPSNGAEPTDSAALSDGAGEETPPAETSEDSTASDGVSDAQETVLDYDAAMALPDGLTLSLTDFTVRQAGRAAALKASGGQGTVQWFSQDPSVATVDSDGTVNAVSTGTIQVVAADGIHKGVCIVRVNIPAESAAAQSAADYHLNRTDFTRSVSEGQYQLKIEGGDVSGPVTWTSSRPGVATVDENGLVTPVSQGRTTVTASWGEHVLECIVRVR